MKIKIIKGGPWRIKGNRRVFKVGQVLEPGKDVPDNIAEEMLKHDYAEVMSGKPKIETKKAEEPDKTVEIPKPDFDIYSTDDKDVLEKYAREKFGLELDKRKSVKVLRKQIENAKEKAYEQC